MPRRWTRRAVQSGLTRLLLLFSLALAPGCSDTTEPGLAASSTANPTGQAAEADTGSSLEPQGEPGWILSLSPLGTRALLAMGLGDRIAVADAESQALLPEPPAPPVPAHGSGLDPAGPPPQLALVPPLFERLAPEVDALLARAARVVVVDPHDFDDARLLYDEIGEAVGEPERAAATQRRVADLLGPIGAASSGRERPCVVVVVGLEPLTLAGGHSFESNVPELLGAESATHDLSEANRLAASREEILELAPDLVLVADEGSSVEARFILARELAPLDVVPATLESASLWLADRAEAEPQLVFWSSLVARARENAAEHAAGRARANCGRTWGSGSEGKSMPNPNAGLSRDAPSSSAAEK